MTDKQLGIAAAIVAVVLGVIVWLLVTGGAKPVTRADDPSGDVRIDQGPRPPEEPDIADVRSASVTARGDEIEFAVRMAQPIPDVLRKQGLDWRWELYENGAATWKVFASLDVAANATILSQDGSYSTSTVDETLPGSLEVDAATLTVVIDRTQIPGLPKEFSWKLVAALDHDKADPRTALAEDEVPNAGFLQFTTEEG